MTLEVHVVDTVHITDGLVGAMEIIEKSINKFLLTDNEEALTITITKVGNKAPPVLKIHVEDTVRLKSLLG